MNIFKMLFGIKSANKPTTEPATELVPARPEPKQPAASESEQAILMMELSDYSGYVRQEALRRCAALGQSELLSFVIIRLNDWVPAVRKEARKTMQHLLPLASVPQRLQILPGVLRLREMSRSDHTDWLLDFERQMLDLISVQDLLDGVCSKDAHFARSCFYMLRQHALCEPEQVISLALATRSDNMLATQALQLCGAMAPDLQTKLYLKAMASPFSRIRTSALLALTQGQLSHEVRIVVRASLFDRQAPVRYLAIHCLQSLGVDVRAIYHAVLSDTASSTQARRTSLLSLASLRDAQDLALIRNFTQAQLPSIRLAAYTAWFKMTPSEKDAIALQAAGDTASSMQKFALQLLQQQGAYIPYATLEALLEGSGKHDLLLAYAAVSKWQWLSSIAHLSMSQASQRAFTPHLRHHLLSWAANAHRSASVPDDQQRRRLAQESAQTALYALLADRDNDCRAVLERELAQHQLRPQHPASTAL